MVKVDVIRLSNSSAADPGVVMPRCESSSSCSILSFNCSIFASMIDSFIVSLCSSSSLSLPFGGCLVSSVLFLGFCFISSFWGHSCSVCQDRLFVVSTPYLVLLVSLLLFLWRLR